MSSSYALHDPHRFEMSLGRDPVSGRVLAMPFFREQAYGKALDDSGLFEEYGYRSSADKPANLTEEEWHARRDAWERVWPGYEPSGMSMLTFRLRPENDTGMLRLVAWNEERGFHPVLQEALNSHSRRSRAARVAVEVAASALREIDPDADPIRTVMEAARGNDIVVDAVASLLADVTAEDLYARGEVTRSVDTAPLDEAIERWIHERGLA